MWLPSPTTISRALQQGLAPLVFWRVFAKREREAFEDLTPGATAEPGAGAKKALARARATTTTTATARATTARHVAELETPLSRTTGPHGGVMLPSPWWKRRAPTGDRRLALLATAVGFAGGLALARWAAVGSDDGDAKKTKRNAGDDGTERERRSETNE
jgi:hypothetical protein